MNAKSLASSVLVVVVNYGTPQLVVDCLLSLEVEQRENHGLRVSIVDNGSRDQSVSVIAQAIERHRWSSWVTMVPAGVNGGFSAGNNRAIRDALRSSRPFQYFMLLNPDTRVCPGAIGRLLAFMASRPEIGILGSALEGPDGELQPAAHNMPSPLTELEEGASFYPITRLMQRRIVTPPIRHHAHRCEWVSGASMMVRREVFERIGLLDESFFLYFEEVDFCFRAAQAGWEIWYLPEARVVHLEGAATGIKTKRARRATWWYASRRRFFIKTYGVCGWILADTLWAIGRASLKARRFLHLGGGDGADEPLHFSRDLVGGDLKALFTGQARRVRGNA